MQRTACSEHPGAKQRLGACPGLGTALGWGPGPRAPAAGGRGWAPWQDSWVPRTLCQRQPGCPKNRPSQRVHIKCKHFLLLRFQNSVLGDQGPFACQAEPGPLCVGPRPETALRAVRGHGMRGGRGFQLRPQLVLGSPAPRRPTGWTSHSQTLKPLGKKWEIRQAGC